MNSNIDAMADVSFLSIQKVTKNYGRIRVLNEIELDVQRREYSRFSARAAAPSATKVLNREFRTSVAKSRERESTGAVMILFATCASKVAQDCKPV
ncbi:MAG: hypothetical protein EOQ42_15060 [Mesorhizobium sp.]|nr:MAG: hypothetical protein EOQ42_15060 [Mesorhizobium sp.]